MTKGKIVAKSKERVRIAMSPETVQSLLLTKAAQERRNLSASHFYTKVMTAFAEKSEWDIDTLSTTEAERRKEANQAHRDNPDGQQWRELADQAAACGQIMEIASGDVDSLRRLEKSLDVEIPELRQYDASIASS